MNIPVAKARSFLGNHSATVLIAAGKFPASKRPNAKRAMPNPKALLANACPIAAKLQPVSTVEYPDLVPTISIILPINNNPIAYAALKAVTI